MGVLVPAGRIFRLTDDDDSAVPVSMRSGPAQGLATQTIFACRSHVWAVPLP
jgi:hypothetical protein